MIKNGPVLVRCFFFLLCVALPSRLWGQETAPLSAESILIAAENRMYAFQDQSSRMTFRIIGVNGAEDRSVFTLYWKNYEGLDGFNSKSLFVTELPKKDKGQKFLVWEYVDEGQSDQWIYLPELRQIRRVHPNHHQHEGTVSSDLLMTDVRKRRIDKDKHRLLPEEKVNNDLCYVVEKNPVTDSPYSRMVLYISKKDNTLRKVDFYSEKGDLAKTQTIDWEEIGGAFVWKRSETIDARTGSKTIVELSQTRINRGLRDDLFTDRALRR